MDIVFHHDAKDLNHSLIEAERELQLSFSFSFFFWEKLDSKLFQRCSKLNDVLKASSLDLYCARQSFVRKKGGLSAKICQAEAHLLGVDAAGGWIQSDF